MKSRIKRILVQCGVGPEYRGYTYLVEAIYMEMEYKRKHTVPMKVCELYNEVGKKFEVNGKRVERCIRHCIQNAFALYTPILQLYFVGCIEPSGKVTNNRFINVMADRISSLDKNKIVRTPEEMVESGWCDDCSGSYYHCKLEGKCEGFGEDSENAI